MTERATDSMAIWMVNICLLAGVHFGRSLGDERLPFKVHAAVGKDVTLTCRDGCRSQCTVRWFREGEAGETKRLPENSQQQGNNLLIRGVNMQNYGSYVCVARNSKGVSKDRIVLDAPFSVTLDAQEIVYGDGDCVRVTCKSTDGGPEVILDWTKDKKPIQDTSVVIQTKDGQSNLMIYFTLDKHQGQYTCHGRRGPETVTANLTLKYDHFAKKGRNSDFC